MPSHPPDDPLSRALADWHVNPSRDPQFRSAVSRRVDAARRPSTWSKFARAHPAVVSALLLGAVLAGAWSGRTEARERIEADRTAIAANYVHSLDARWMRAP
jgi:hypothetical protein